MIIIARGNLWLRKGLSSASGMEPLSFRGWSATVPLAEKGLRSPGLLLMKSAHWVYKSMNMQIYIYIYMCTGISAFKELRVSNHMGYAYMYMYI